MAAQVPVPGGCSLGVSLALQGAKRGRAAGSIELQQHKLRVKDLRVALICLGGRTRV